MRDVAEPSTELRLGRDDADTDVSDHRGDVTGREDVARAEMGAGCNVSCYSAGVVDNDIGGETEHANIVHVRTTMCEHQASPAKTLKICVVEHSVNICSENLNILSSGSIKTCATWCLIHKT